VGGSIQLTETRKVVEDAPCIKSLRESGAMMIGKSCMVEFGLSALGCNVVQGTPRNPYNISHHCGGSSSGSAAAVACGLCPFALGTPATGPSKIFILGYTSLRSAEYPFALTSHLVYFPSTLAHVSAEFAVVLTASDPQLHIGRGGIGGLK
jgi:hypothetical protein